MGCKVGGGACSASPPTQPLRFLPCACSTSACWGMAGDFWHVQEYRLTQLAGMDRKSSSFLQCCTLDMCEYPSGMEVRWVWAHAWNTASQTLSRRGDLICEATWKLSQMTLDPGTWSSHDRLIKWATAHCVSAHSGYCTHRDRHEEVSLVLYYSCILGSHKIPSA